MKLRLTKDQMLAQWKLRHHLEPLRADCVSVRTRAPGLDAYCEAEMRSRYVDLLARADAEYLAPVNVAINCTLRRADMGRGIIDGLPEGVVRVTRVKIMGWEREATVVTDRRSPLWRRQMNRFSAGGIVEPVALWTGGKSVEVFSIGSSVAIPMVEVLEVVIDEGEQVYAFDERAWELLTE